jgi:IclR family acetate operon transcriptional repressor
VAGARLSPPQVPRIQSLARASRILEVIAARGIAALAEIAAETGLNKTTAFYLAESLATLGFAERVDGRGYRLGLKNLELGRAVQRRLDIAALGRPSMIILCALSRETVNLAVPFVFDAMIVESLEGAHGVRATSYAGSRAAYHSTACGKAILAFMEPAVRGSLYKARPLAAITHNTITEERALEAQLALIRERGFAVDMEENELGANCVAAPIHDGLDIAGSISISGLAIRLPKRRLSELGSAIIEETKRISAMLGAADPGLDAESTSAPAVGSGKRSRF